MVNIVSTFIAQCLHNWDILDEFDKSWIREVERELRMQIYEIALKER